MAQHIVPQWVIEKKCDGEALTQTEINYFVNGYTAGLLPDFQMSAWLMAIYHQGMNYDETTWLTQAMINSGSTLSHPKTKPVVDKHSTGGVGDKVSLILAPLVATCGVNVPMISGRGLGSTGGTLDKLQSIPGYRIDLSEAEFIRQVQQCGCSIIGQTADLAPADRKIYSLRDVTATVRAIPLMTASILSKKIASGIDALVLDVKYGHGANMSSYEPACALAASLQAVSERLGKPSVAMLTDMDSPLGRTVGNSLEIIEVVEALQGQGCADLMEVTYGLACQMLLVANVSDSAESALDLLERKLVSGEAFEKFVEMVALQGGDVSYIHDTHQFPQAPLQDSIVAEQEGYVSAIKAGNVGRALIMLGGGGRRHYEDDIDHRVGIVLHKAVGDKVVPGEAIATIYGKNTHELSDAKQLVAAALRVQREPLKPQYRIAQVVGADDSRAVNLATAFHPHIRETAD